MNLPAGRFVGDTRDGDMQAVAAFTKRLFAFCQTGVGIFCFDKWGAGAGMGGGNCWFYYHWQWDRVARFIFSDTVQADMDFNITVLPPSLNGWRHDIIGQSFLDIASQWHNR